MTHPLGILRSGATAFVDDRGTVAVRGMAWELRWWVAAEDRWHRPDADAAVRHRLIDDTPVAETVVRVPGGDAVGVAYGFAAGGRPALAGRVTNASPVPIAVAVVVGPARSIALHDATIVVDGTTAIHLSRRPSRSASAPSLDELAVAVAEATAMPAGEPAASPGRFTAFVVPLPHTQAVAWQVVDEGVAAATVPEPEQVAAGWTRHAGEGAQLTLPARAMAGFGPARHVVALGPAPGDGLGVLARQVGASVRLGWFDAALDGTDVLAGAQRPRGRIGDDASSTAAALDALASWRFAGIPADRLEHLVGPVVSAARWLDRRLGRFDPDVRREATAALGTAARFLRLTDQPDVADHLDRVIAAAPDRRPASNVASRFPDDDPAAIVSAVVDAAVTDSTVGIELLGGWEPSWGREPADASNVPSPWGLVSFALRWHGARPALLWEVEPWPDVLRADPAVCAPTLDPAWRGSGFRGEALLAEPVAAGGAIDSFS